MQAHRPRKLWTAVGVLVTLLAGAAVGAGVFFALRQAYPEERTAACPEPSVVVDAGRLRGACRPAMRGVRPQYAAFLGVPYAKPPLRELRFKSPRPVDPWDGVRDAVMHGPTCIQGPADVQTGAEDCLHLNVYSAWLQQRQQRHGKDQEPQPPLQPVLVHVHGGAMTRGSGNPIRPEYFLANGLIVVTFNYRLGHFGFLNLDSDLAPGNAGFKDMIAALQWVSRNIRRFGGDPGRVTVQGCSSAAASVHWLTLLPETEGLFHRAIVKSASAMVSWAYVENHRDLSDAALAFLRTWWQGGSGGSSGATDQQILQSASTELLNTAFTYAEKHRKRLGPETYQSPTVSVERRPDGEEPRLIARDPESYLLNPARKSRVPLLMGITECEYEPLGDMYFITNELPDVTSPQLEIMLPRSAIPLADAKEALGISGNYSHNFTEMVSDFRNEFFNLNAVDLKCRINCRWEQFFSDTVIKVDTVRSIRLHARLEPGPVYAYRYEYPVAGGCAYHAADDRIVWPESEDNLMQLNTTTPLSLNVLRQVTMFTNFVKYGTPVPKTDDTVLTSEWPPMSQEGPDVFLRIGVNLTLSRGEMMGKFASFWEDLFSKYRDNKGI